MKFMLALIKTILNNNESTPINVPADASSNHSFDNAINAIQQPMPISIHIINTIIALSNEWFDDASAGTLIGVLSLLLSIVLGYLSVMFTYGYGELIESTMQIRDKLCGTSTSYTSSSMGGGYTSTPPTGRYSAPTSSSGHSGGGKSFGARRSL